MSIFEKAILSGLRFKTNKGLITTEDVSVLNINTLRDMANIIHRDITEEPVDIFEVPSKSCEEQQLRLDILKRIIEVRVEAKNAKVTAAADAAFNASLDARIKANDEKALDSLSNEELEKLKR